MERDTGFLGHGHDDQSSSVITISGTEASARPSAAAPLAHPLLEACQDEHDAPIGSTSRISSPLPQGSSQQHSNIVLETLSIIESKLSTNRTSSTQEATQDHNVPREELPHVSVNMPPPTSEPPEYIDRDPPPLIAPPTSEVAPQASTLSPVPLATPTPTSTDDELPVYVLVPGSELPFKLHANLSTTYTVIPSQGPAEFRVQSRQARRSVLNHSQSAESAGRVLDPISRPRHQLGAWTLEYWLGDTIQYLCYLMDPKLSAMADPTPGTNRIGCLQGSTSFLRPTAEPSSTQASAPAISVNNLEMNIIQESHPSSSSQAQQSNRSSRTGQNRDHARLSREIPVAQTMVAQDTIMLRGRANQRNQSHSGSGLAEDGRVSPHTEWVPTSHIRGSPPPLNRARHSRSQRYSLQQVAENAEALQSGRRITRVTSIDMEERPSTRPPHTTVTVQPTQDGQTDVVQSQLDPAPDPHTVQNSTDVPSVPLASAETATPSAVNDGNAGVEPTTEESTEEPVTRPSRLSAQGTVIGMLPSVQHIQINDGYSGEELDTILAHRINMEPGDHSVHVGASNTIAHNNVLTSEFFKSPTFAFVSAEDPQTWIWWSTHHETNLQQCRQEGPNDEITMWWRTRLDFYSTENKKKRQELKKIQKQLSEHRENVGLKERWRRTMTGSSMPHNQSMEITMRMRGLCYAWREETYELPLIGLSATTGGELASQDNPQRQQLQGQPEALSELDAGLPPWSASTNTRKLRRFVLVRDDSTVMGQLVEGGPVAEAWLIEVGPNDQTQQDHDAIHRHHATGSQMNQTIPSEDIQETREHLVSKVVDSQAVAGAETLAIPPVSSTRRSSMTSAQPSMHSGSSQLTSSFPRGLRQRHCVIRVLRGLSTDVETFALSTGPRLPELFNLYTIQSIPGPSRGGVVCSLCTFAVIIVVVFLVIALSQRR
ncbi:hypothetical protein BGX34_007572 [Mortierella sp. NVP85]|nr:hypothetical protein BGX34_007572 [Mortierella sp. NVP85]